jgi:2-polyprenyl-6-methoxyphenol hydroxylase-like FAD-dependent oxidoreductase
MSAAIIGGGVAGASYAALFLARGVAIRINGRSPNIAERVCVQLDAPRTAAQAIRRIVECSRWKIWPGRGRVAITPTMCRS